MLLRSKKTNFTLLSFKSCCRKSADKNSLAESAVVLEDQKQLENRVTAAVRAELDCDRNEDSLTWR